MAAWITAEQERRRLAIQQAAAQRRCMAARVLYEEGLYLVDCPTLDEEMTTHQVLTRSL